MGACYNTILIPTGDRQDALRAIEHALQLLEFKVIHYEEPDARGSFQYPSCQSVFVAPTTTARWTPLSSWGDGLPAPFPSWYRENPLAAKLSVTHQPVVYFFSYDSGFVAGYSIFADGKQIEAQSLPWRPDLDLSEFTPSIKPPEQPTGLGELLGDASFNYESFARGFGNLEIATAALADRFGLNVHLLDPLDIQDGDGGIAVEGDDFKTVELSNWIAVYYDKDAT